MLKAITTAIAAVAVISGAFIIAALLYPLVGAFVGVVFGFFFSDTAAAILEFLGLTGRIEFWQLGAALAFIGAFFRSTNQVQAQKNN